MLSFTIHILAAVMDEGELKIKKKIQNRKFLHQPVYHGLMGIRTFKFFLKK